MHYLLSLPLKLTSLLLLLGSIPGYSQSTDSVRYQMKLVVKNLPPQTIEVRALHQKSTLLGEFSVSKPIDTLVIIGKTHQELALSIETENRGSLLLPIYQEKALVVADFKDFRGTVALHQRLQVKGSQRIRDLQAIYRTSRWFGPLMRLHRDRRDSLLAIQAPDSLVAQAQQQLAAIYDRRINDFVALVKQTSSPTVAHRCLLHLLDYVKNISQIKFTQRDLFNLYQYYIAQYPQHILTKGIRRQAQHLTVGIGKLAPDFTLPNTSGVPQRLSSLRGQYVLLDFWASWCKPCRQESPYLRQAHTQFGPQGFTIVSVSVDNKANAWQKAIQKDQLHPWLHVRDAQGWQSPTLKTYGVQQLPANFLLDPTGKIIAINLRKQLLLQKLNKLLKSGD